MRSNFLMRSLYCHLIATSHAHVWYVGYVGYVEVFQCFSLLNHIRLRYIAKTNYPFVFLSLGFIECDDITGRDGNRINELLLPQRFEYKN